MLPPWPSRAPPAPSLASGARRTRLCGSLLSSSGGTFRAAPVRHLSSRGAANNVWPDHVLSMCWPHRVLSPVVCCAPPCMRRRGSTSASESSASRGGAATSSGRLHSATLCTTSSGVLSRTGWWSVGAAAAPDGEVASAGGGASQTWSSRGSCAPRGWTCGQLTSSRPARGAATASSRMLCLRSVGHAMESGLMPCDVAQRAHGYGTAMPTQRSSCCASCSGSMAGHALSVRLTWRARPCLWVGSLSSQARAFVLYIIQA